MLVPRDRDAVDHFINHERRIRHQEIRRERGAGGPQYENFIVDPTVVRAYPPAYVYAGEIIAVRWRPVGGSCNVRFYHNSTIIHTAGVVTTPGVYTFTTPIEIADGDIIFPELTAVAAASPATFSFLVQATAT